jgi:hypothetical protein
MRITEKRAIWSPIANWPGAPACWDQRRETLSAPKAELTAIIRQIHRSWAGPDVLDPAPTRPGRIEVERATARRPFFRFGNWDSFGVTRGGTP